MNIKAVDQTAIVTMSIKPSLAKASREDAMPAKDKSIQVEQTISATPDETMTPIVDTVGENESVPGVLRLLQEGHFKGVADVRLRINFADEIAALEKEQTAPIAAGGVAGLAELVTNGMESFSPENGLDQQAATGIGEATESFTASIQQILGEYQSGSLSGAGELTARLQAGFDGFVSSVQTMLDASIVPEPQVLEETIPTETGEISLPIASAVSVADNELPAEETPSFDFQAALADLTAAFATKLQELETALNAVQVLPPLSEPHGNGGAYDKFLAIYNDMQGAPVSETSLPAVDAIV